MGRPKSKDFTPEEFQNLSREERVLRGKMSLCIRMIKTREEEIRELMKPIQKKEKDIENYKKQLTELKLKIKDLGLDFPEFRIEDYIVKGKNYYRGVWYVNSKKTQLYLGSEVKVHSRMSKILKGFEKLSQKVKNEEILKEYRSDLQLNYWEKEYKKFKSETSKTD